VAIREFLFFVASHLTVNLSILLGLYKFRHAMVAIVHKSDAKPTKPATAPPNTTIYLKSGNQYLIRQVSAYDQTIVRVCVRITR